MDSCIFRSRELARQEMSVMCGVNERFVFGLMGISFFSCTEQGGGEV